MALTPWSLRWGLCVVGECTPEYNAHKGLRRTRVCPSLAYRQNLLSSLKTTEHHSALQSTLSWQQSSRAWWCHGVSGSLARGKRLSHASSKWFPIVLGHTAGSTCARISSLDAVRAATTARTLRQSWRASVLCGHPEPGLRVWECSTDHCWKQRHTTDTFFPICSVIRLPARFQRFALFVLISLYHHWSPDFHALSNLKTCMHSCTIIWIDMHNETEK